MYAVALFPHSILRDALEEGGDVNLLGISSGVRLVSAAGMLNSFRRCRHFTSFAPLLSGGHTTLDFFEDARCCR